ncbi:MAG: signal peptidase II [Caldiserica bacterium]|jgi:signal peptidase II|nr:signal peptidase II [Caldisericota bacterium]MDH7562970.1 signal peptidase II [Caldisericota bacterium]
MNILGVFFLVVFLDQLSKGLALSSLSYLKPIPLIGNFLFLTLNSNTGAAFGILPWAYFFFLIFASGALVFSFLFFKTLSQLPPSFQVAIGLVLGGAAGNLLDRLNFGRVVDFIDFRVWPVFNLADASIVIGGILLFLLLLFSRSGNKSPSRI